MKINKWTAAVFAAFVANEVSAQQYRAEVELDFEQVYSDRLPFNLGATQVSGRWFLASVDAIGLPLAEADFLTRSSSVALTLEDMDTFMALAALAMIHCHGR